MDIFLILCYNYLCKSPHPFAASREYGVIYYTFYTER